MKSKEDFLTSAVRLHTDKDSNARMNIFKDILKKDQISKHKIFHFYQNSPSSFSMSIERF